MRCIIKKSILGIVLLFVLGIQFIAGGCKFSFDSGKELTYFGSVTFQGEGLEGVKIVDSVNHYATTDENGDFSFTSKKTSIKIFAVKQGYKFTPKTVEADSSQPIEFIAKESTALTGKLRLEEILFTPTSIISLPTNNFSYIVSGKNCVKVCGITVFYNDTQIIERDSTVFAEKQVPTNILNYNDNFSFNIENGIANFKIKYSLRVYYTYDKNEAIVNETTRVISNTFTLYDSNLDENGCVYFSATGINSLSSGYSYNISFVFKFIV